MIDTIVQIIQAMLAPGLMISACGLLLLGMNNKYSLVVNRIRLLDDEERKLKIKKKETELKSYEGFRLENIQMQIAKLTFRVRLVRNAVLFYSIAVALFVLSCLSIGMQLILDKGIFASLALVMFLGGMVAVLTGVIFAALETWKGYEIIKIEVNID
ncbi:MAG: DUF2721 domain-containing protein [Bacteroidales bacterium]